MVHRMFSIPELCAAMANPTSATYIDPPCNGDYWENLMSLDQDIKAKPTVAALARVSRNFSEPAIAALRMRLLHVVLLLRLLPKNIIWVEDLDWRVHK
jgi:hypothetical protein